ncbi:MAG TPA: hypothetical protein VNG13_07950 [Mycobacteriales bacterium]|nr:hypothetical protein [Mycobacteriales bacterium]
MPPKPPLDIALRRCALAVSVLHDVDLRPSLTGIVLTQVPRIKVTWAEIRRAVAGADPESDLARTRLARWLAVRRWLASRTARELAEMARPYGVPVESELHPGLDWVRLRVLGDALDIGLGFVGLDPTHPDDIVVPPQRLLEAAGFDADPWWPAQLVYLEQMGRMAAERYLRQPAAPLRPMGDCDVVTLLGSRSLRVVLVAASEGMRSAAVPMRVRGWLDLTRIDPAYVLAAAALTEAPHRGFPRPLLVTADELALARPGGQPEQLVLRDPAVHEPWLRDVLYR